MKRWNRKARAHCLRRLREQRMERYRARDVVVMIAGTPHLPLLEYSYDPTLNAMRVVRNDIRALVDRTYRFPPSGWFSW